MVYKNFLLRLLFTFLFISFYLLISYIDFYYIFYLILIIYFLIFLEIYIYFTKYKLIMILYVLLSFTSFLFIDFNSSVYKSFNLFIFIVITFDTFSYLIGTYFGRNKLTYISPNKTIEGFFGGIMSSFILSLILSYYLNFSINFNLTLFILLIIFAAFVGDIVESFFKRKNFLKNSSELIPGHGGVFDRFDSFLFSIIFYSISINI